MLRRRLIFHQISPLEFLTCLQEQHCYPMVSPAFSFFYTSSTTLLLYTEFASFPHHLASRHSFFMPGKTVALKALCTKTRFKGSRRRSAFETHSLEFGSTLHKHRLFRYICINCFFFLCQSTKVCFVSILSWVLRDVDNYSCCFSSALAYIDIFGRKFWFLEAVWWKFHEIRWKLLCLERDVLSEKRKKKDKFGDGTAWKGRRFFWGKWSM